MVNDLQQRLIKAVASGAPLVEIDSQIIEPSPVDEDEKAALWLYAESLRDLGDRDCSTLVHRPDG